MSGSDKISKEIITNQNNRVIIQLTKPLNAEEICSITLEPIYENPSIHDFQILDRINKDLAKFVKKSNMTNCKKYHSIIDSTIFFRAKLR